MTIRFVLVALCAATLVCVFGTSARAGDARPEPPVRTSAAVLEDRRRATLVIESVDLAREVELILPRAMKHGAAIGALDEPTPARNVIAGLALSLALATAGLWATRSRRSPAARGAAAAVAITAVVAGAGGYALGNYSPYADADAKPGTLRDARPSSAEARGEVRVLYTSDDGAVHLRIPKTVFHEER